MKGQPQDVVAFSWRAQMRLLVRYRRLLDKGGSRSSGGRRSRAIGLRVGIDERQVGLLDLGRASARPERILGTSM